MPSGRGAGEACSVIALLAPGQGAQTPGMLAPWLVDDATRATLARWSDATGLDLERLGTTADAEEIKDTAVTQPLVVATALLAHSLLSARVELPGVAGHRRALRRGAGRGRDRRRADPGRRRGAGRRARPRDGRGVRARAHRHERGPRREPRRGARPPRGARAGSRQPQRRGPDRRRRTSRRAGPARRGPACPGARDAAGRRRGVPHPVHGACGAGTRRARRHRDARGPGHHVPVQRRRRRGERRRGRAAAARRPGHAARPLGRVPGDPA